MQKGTLLRRALTRFSPCALRIVQDEFVIVGTYELDKSSGYRTGSLEVYNSDLELIYFINTCGAILDVKCSSHVPNLIATAHSTGNVMLWKFSDKQLIQLDNLQVLDTMEIISSVNFFPLKDDLLALTSTEGIIKIIDITTGKKTTVVKVQGKTEQRTDIVKEFEPLPSVHSLECWTSEFAELAPLENVLFSGGDDCAIIAHDLRTKEMIWSNKSIHGGGVVAIKASTSTFRRNMPTSLVTGSYDDQIRLFDLRMFKDTMQYAENPLVPNIQNLNLGGGVWRFAESPFNRNSDNINDLVVCCMYDGARIVSVNNSGFKVGMDLSKGHDSISYGCDWGQNYIATCSFYDKSLQLWKYIK